MTTFDLTPVDTGVGAEVGPAASGGACCSPLVTDPMDASRAEQLAASFKALADPTRLRLLSIVAKSEGEEACVCDLIEPVGLSQPTVSHHLKILATAGFLERSKRGTWAYYKLVPGALDRMSQLLADA
ncbi:ArsR/SmtB family transcription factor [Agromyces sp. SYSU T00266]|uniref:ArsR/SmtB family transcription factor n=1 Tax=Agromyces zhanjiangensis TaxID=3158562 RepID=UPI00339947FB